MAEKRQPFRFRLPWLAPAQPAQPEPAVPRPSQGTQAQSQPTPAPRFSQGTQASSQPTGSQTQRPPYRPETVAPAQTPPPPAPSARTEPQSSPQSSQGLSKPAQQRPPASPSQKVPQIKATFRPASPAQVSSKPEEATKALPQPPSSPSSGATQLSRPQATTAPPSTSSQAKPQSPSTKPPTITSEISQNPDEVRQIETSIPPSEETKPAIEEHKTKATTKLVAEVSSPKQEPNPQPVKELHTTSYREPKQVLGGTHDRLKRDAIDKEVTSSHTQIKMHHDKGQQSDEEVFDIKEVFQKLENSGCANEGEIHNRQERVSKFPHKHAMAGGRKASFHKEVKENFPKSVHKQKHLFNGKPFCILTLTGENTGATMHIRSESRKKEMPVYIHRGYKDKSDEITETSTDGEGTSIRRKSEEKNIQKELATKSYVNNNTQGINNSLVFDSIIAEKNPGVHVVLSRNTIEPIKPGKEREMLDTHKVEVRSTPAERLAYAPTIRRRCLRGLFLESSDSDPEKPRRHGCRIRCTQKEGDTFNNVV